MRLGFFLLILVFLNGCSNPPRRLYFRDLNLSAAYLSRLNLAVNTLNNSAGSEVIGFQGTKPISIRMVHKLNDGKTKDSQLAHARYLEYHCLIELREDLEEQVRQQYDPFSPQSVSTQDVDQGIAMIIMHEIGHCYGLTHSPDPLNIMYEDFNPHWDTQSIEEFSKRLLTLI